MCSLSLRNFGRLSLVGQDWRRRAAQQLTYRRVAHIGRQLGLDIPIEFRKFSIDKLKNTPSFFDIFAFLAGDSFDAIAQLAQPEAAIVSQRQLVGFGIEAAN